VSWCIIVERDNLLIFLGEIASSVKPLHENNHLKMTRNVGWRWARQEEMAPVFSIERPQFGAAVLRQQIIILVARPCRPPELDVREWEALCYHPEKKRRNTQQQRKPGQQIEQSAFPDGIIPDLDCRLAILPPLPRAVADCLAFIRFQERGQLFDFPYMIGKARFPDRTVAKVREICCTIMAAFQITGAACGTCDLYQQC